MRIEIQRREIQRREIQRREIQHREIQRIEIQHIESRYNFYFNVDTEFYEIILSLLENFFLRF